MTSDGVVVKPLLNVESVVDKQAALECFALLTICYFKTFLLGLSEPLYE